MNKCVTCIFYNLQANSLNYNLSKCIKYNTFVKIARLDETKCGKDAKDYEMTISEKDKQKKEPKIPEIQCHI